MMRIKRVIGSAAAFSMLLLAAGCDGQTRAQKVEEAAEDIAMVERMSKEPFTPILPEPVTEIDQARYGLARPGCTFTRTGDKDPIFVAGSDEGFMRLKGEFERYAAKKDSAELPGGARSTYIGLQNWADILRQPDEAQDGVVSDQSNWPARFMLHDAQDRVAFMADGVMACNDGKPAA